MKAYPEERKEALLRRMMPPENAPVSALARETGITEQTLYTWRRQAKGRGVAVPGDGKNPEGWSSEDKFAVVLEAAALNAAELAEYCRRKGLYPEQIAAWRAACQAANANAPERQEPVGNRGCARTKDRSNRRHTMMARVLSGFQSDWSPKDGLSPYG